MERPRSGGDAVEKLSTGARSDAAKGGFPGANCCFRRGSGLGVKSIPGT